MSVIFDQLKISSDGNTMYIDAHVGESSYFDRISLDYIAIVPANNEEETVPALEDNKEIYKLTFGEDVRTLSLVLTKASFDEAFNNTDSKGAPIAEGPTASVPFTEANLNRNLFFIYVAVKGTFDPSIPCGLDRTLNLGVAFNVYILYRKAMDYTKELIKECSEHKAFTDYILLWNAFKSSLITGHYLSAIKFFKLLFLDGNNVSNATNCGCHG